MVSGPSTIRAQLTGSGAGLWGAAAFMGYVNTVLGFGGWAWLIQQHGAGKVAPMSLMVPVFGMVASGLYFHEAFAPLKLLGTALVFSGLLHVFGGPLWLRWKERKNAQTL